MGTRGTTAGAGAGAVAVAVARVAIVLRRVLIIAFLGVAGRGEYIERSFLFSGSPPDRRFGSREDSGDNSLFFFSGQVIGFHVFM